MFNALTVSFNTSHGSHVAESSKKMDSRGGCFVIQRSNEAM
jgi:hypothetical protein